MHEYDTKIQKGAKGYTVNANLLLNPVPQTLSFPSWRQLLLWASNYIFIAVFSTVK